MKSAQYRQDINSGEKITFSIILPTHNRSDEIRYCMESLNCQSLDRSEWEVIVVDDGSLPPVKKILCALSLNFRWRYHYQANSGPAMARNVGAAMARGKYLVFLDDDCEPIPTWLEVLKNNMMPGLLVGGKIVNKIKNNLFSEASQLLVTYLYEKLVNTKHYFFTSNNLALGKRSFFETGAFNTAFQTAAGEDRELCVRSSHLGYKLHYAPEALVHHSHHLDFRSYLKQHFNYGRSCNTFRTILRRLNVDLSMKYPHFFSKLLLYPLRANHYSSLEKLSLALLLGLSQVIYAIGYFYERFVCQDLDI